MMSVMVPFSSDSISSTGPGIGSCWQRCSARRICCRFCQMISASFSHLEGARLSTHWSSAPCPIPPHQALTRSAAHPRCLRVGPHSLPAAADASTGSAHHPGWLFAACAAAAASSGASQPGPVRWDNIRGSGTGYHRDNIIGSQAASLTTRYCCSVWASRCSQASSDAFFCCSVVSRDMRSWGPSWESWENWAGEQGMVLGLALPAPQTHAPRPPTHLGVSCSPGTG